MKKQASKQRIERSKMLSEINMGYRTAVLAMLNIGEILSVTRLVHPVRQGKHAEKMIEQLDSAIEELMEARRLAKGLK